MQLDFEDILSGTLGRIVLLALFLISATWVGGMVGGIAWSIGRNGLEPRELVEAVLFGPLRLLNLWLVPNVAFLAIMLTYLLFNDEFNHTAWGIIVGFESLFVMLGWGTRFHETKGTVIAWSCWLALLVMVETGIWLHRQMRRNRWAREFAELSAENAMRRAEREARATGGVEEAADTD